MGDVPGAASAAPAHGGAHQRRRPRRPARPAAAVTALSGLRILDLTRLLPGPFCTQLLADLGADVVKIEDPRGGDPARHGQSAGIFRLVNRNKRSLTLNLRTDQ